MRSTPHLIQSTVALLAASTASSACLDIDGDNTVGQTDLLQLIAEWGDCSACSSDVDHSGTVDLDDLLPLLSAWGPCASDGIGLFNYGQALQTAVLFYEAQRAGPLPDDARLSWRGDAFMQVGPAQINDQHDVDLRQRYMDAGDSPTFVLPISSAMTMLSWSGVEYPDGWIASGQWDELERTLRWHADWCIAAHPEPNVFCGQIGQGDEAHAFWTPAEVYPDTYTPAIWWLTPDHPGSEPPGEAAAFLAAASLIFQSSDPAYAQLLLTHAEQLHAFAEQHQGLYHETIANVAPFYKSWSGYFDELCWSALWLYRATGDSQWLAKARSVYDTHFLHGTKQWTHNWDDKSYGCMVLLAALTGEQVYRDEAAEWLDYWTVGSASGRVSYTPGGLAWLSTWGSLRYAANSAFLAMVYVDHVGDAPDGRYLSFAEKQINYALGDNPRSSSYVCGFGENPPLRPHHRTAHGSWDDQIGDPEPNRHTLWGALVGGPASADDFDWADDRGDWIANEVACDYNAGFTAALARMAQVWGGDPFPDSEFPPEEDAYGKEMFVEASIIEDLPTSTRVRCLLNNRSAWPARSSDAMSYRIYVDLSEAIAQGYGPSDLEFSAAGSAVVTGPFIADAAANRYYLTVDHAGDVITPGPGTSYVREMQITLGLPGGAPASAWDSTNDPSLASLPFGQTNTAQTEMIPVFDGGAHMYGELGEVDCNDNGVDDADEIADGSAADIDENGVPDSCDPDCNANGLPDGYDIQQGEPDCNGNGAPDSCDINDGHSSDLDADGIPDECQLDGLGWSIVINDTWNGGFTADLTIENHTGEDIAPWTLEFDAAFTVTGLWPIGESLWSQDGSGHVVVQNEPWNDTIADGESLHIGFQASGEASNPGNVQLNGIDVEQLP